MLPLCIVAWSSFGPNRSAAALSGTAAVLTSVGTLIHNNQEFKVGSGEPGEKVAKLRQALNDIQWGKSADTHGWLTKV